MEFLIIGFLVFLLVVAIACNLASNRAEQPTYRLKKSLFTPAERSFLGVLQMAVDGNTVVMGKVRVADILVPGKGLSRSDWQAAFNHISNKHFDFVLLDKNTLKVTRVVELNDRTHNSKSRVQRDNFLSKACNSAGLKLVQIEARKSYKIEEIRHHMDFKIVNKYKG